MVWHEENLMRDFGLRCRSKDMWNKLFPRTVGNKYTLINWSAAVLLFLAFSWWHGAFEGPLKSREIDNIIHDYSIQHPGADTEKLRRFMEEDDGRPVIMVNAIKNYDTPIVVNGKDFGTDSAEALAEYTGFVFPYLIKRGSYPLYSGTAAFNAMEKWGIDNADEWTSGALVRYRSRRVMLEMATDPVFEQFHDAKIAAIEKTFAFPTTADISMGNLSLTVFFTLLSLAFGMQLLINRKGGG
jgi:hypothetical protein